MSTNFESLEKLINETEKERDKRAMAQIREMTGAARAEREKANEMFEEAMRVKDQELKEQMEAEILVAQKEAAERVKAKYAEEYGRREWTGDVYKTEAVKDFVNGLLPK